MGRVWTCIVRNARFLEHGYTYSYRQTSTHTRRAALHKPTNHRLALEPSHERRMRVFAAAFLHHLCLSTGINPIPDDGGAITAAFWLAGQRRGQCRRLRRGLRMWLERKTTPCRRAITQHQPRTGRTRIAIHQRQNSPRRLLRSNLQHFLPFRRFGRWWNSRRQRNRRWTST